MAGDRRARRSEPRPLYKQKARTNPEVARLILALMRGSHEIITSVSIRGAHGGDAIQSRLWYLGYRPSFSAETRGQGHFIGLLQHVHAERRAPGEEPPSDRCSDQAHRPGSCRRWVSMHSLCSAVVPHLSPLQCRLGDTAKTLHRCQEARHLPSGDVHPPLALPRLHWPSTCGQQQEESVSQGLQVVRSLARRGCSSALPTGADQNESHGPWTQGVWELQSSDLPRRRRSLC